MVPAKSKFVSYYRVSTQKQGRSGLGLEAQQATVRQHLATVGGVELASFVEVESGKNAVNRPKLQAALIRCKQTRATLLVAKLDRLSRNAAFLMNLRDSEVKFQALDIPEANTLTLGVMAVLAQHEREIISKRTKEALAARRARGLPLGTPRDLSAYARRASALGRDANRAKALARAKEIAPMIAEAIAGGHTSLRAIAEFLNTLEITTPRGKAWTATAVRNAQQLLKAY
jgi:DNA invertase Pin-like site-specific DNA recombinase